MKSIKPHRLLKTTLLVACGFAFAASSAWATLVTWQLNPNSSDGAVGSSSKVYTLPPGYSITAYGYDNNNGIGSAHELFYRFAPGDEHGLGITGTTHNELQVDHNGNPLQFIQLDLTSIISQGFTNFQIQVASVQAGESFNLYASNALGHLGTLLSGGPYGSGKDDVFINVPNLGTNHFLSIVAAAADVLPVAFRATIVPIPEAASLIPALCLVVLATAFEVRRRRRQGA